MPLSPHHYHLHQIRLPYVHSWFWCPPGYRKTQHFLSCQIRDKSQQSCCASKSMQEPCGCCTLEAAEFTHCLHISVPLWLQPNHCSQHVSFCKLFGNACSVYLTDFSCLSTFSFSPSCWQQKQPTWNLSKASSTRDQLPTANQLKIQLKGMACPNTNED